MKRRVWDRSLNSVTGRWAQARYLYKPTTHSRAKLTCDLRTFTAAARRRHTCPHARAPPLSLPAFLSRAGRRPSGLNGCHCHRRHPPPTAEPRAGSVPAIRRRCNPVPRPAGAARPGGDRREGICPGSGGGFLRWWRRGAEGPHGAALQCPHHRLHQR